MGRKGREILDMDVKPIIRSLQGAYASEWLAHYNFLHAAQIMVGINAPQVATMLKAKAAGELTHAMRIGERILELGGALPTDWAEIPKVAHGSRWLFPKNAADLKGILKVILNIEREAIDVYQALHKSTIHRDTVTHELAEELLADEVKDEEEIENLLGE